MHSVLYPVVMTIARISVEKCKLRVDLRGTMSLDLEGWKVDEEVLKGRMGRGTMGGGGVENDMKKRV